MKRKTRTRTLLSEMAVFTTYLALSILMTWPLILNMKTAVSDPGDPWLNSWILNWDFWAATHQPTQFFHATIFHPSRYTLAFSEHLLGIALFVVPFSWIGFPPIAIHNVAMLLGFASAGYGAHLLSRHLTHSSVAAFTGGIVFAFLPFRFGHLAHLQLLWSIWLPVLLLSLVRYNEKPSTSRAAVFGVAFLLNGLTSLYWLIYGSFAAAVTALFFAAQQRDPRRYLAKIGLATAIACGLLLPVAYPYLAAKKLYGLKRYRTENLHGSATWRDWISVPGRQIFYRHLLPVGGDEHTLFPGFGAIALAAAGLAFTRAARKPAEPPALEADPSRRLLRVLDLAAILFAVATAVALRPFEISVFGMTVRSSTAGVPAFFLVLTLLWRVWIAYPGLGGKRSLARTIRESSLPMGYWAAIVWLLLGVIGSFGLNAFLYQVLWRLPLAFRGLRAPTRFAMIAYVGLAVLAAAGVAVLARSRMRPVAILIPALLLFELRAAPIRWYLSPQHPGEVYDWLRPLPLRGAVAELPIRFNATSEVSYLLGHTIHHKKLVNGASGFEPASHQELVVLYADPGKHDALLDKLEEIGVSLLVVHVHELADLGESVGAAVRRASDDGQLKFVQQFKHGISRDEVFAYTKTGANAD